MKIDHWEEDISLFGQTDLDVALSEDDWAMSDDTDDTLSVDTIDTDDDLVAPSEEEIRELMSQMVATEPATDDSSAQEMAAGESGDRLTSIAPQSEREIAEQSTTLSTIESLDPELREAFLDDATSCVGSMEQSLLRLESEPADADALNQICRELHTLKGASASVGLTELADQLHRLEDTLISDQQSARSPDIHSLLRSVDSIRSQVSGDQTEQAESFDPHQTETPAVSIAPPSPVRLGDGPDDEESVRVKSSQLNRLMDMLAQLVMLRNRRQTELSDLQEVYHELIGSVSKMRQLSSETDPESASCSSIQLSEVANDVLEIAQQVRECSAPIAEGNTAVSQFIREFRQELVELRRTPIAGLFQRLQRVVRDAANAENKEVKLQLIGEDAGIERSLQQRLYEPLLHIVRNSVCHGIESPEDRVRAGKDRSGTISLQATSGPDLFVIEVCDDGGGLDYEAIRRRGVESGLLKTDQNATEHELSQLIFQPGFSTRQSADQVAGRGVGMDVVATTLKRMRGWLEVDSESKCGTRIRLSFPLPSVIQHAMVFRSGHQLFALPMQSIQATGETAKHSNCLAFADLIEAESCPDDQSTQRIVLTCETPNGNNQQSRVTLLVDEIIGPEELVVRPLPPLLKHHPYCSGASLSGLGKTVLFLDARRTVDSHQHRSSRATENGASVTASSMDDVQPLKRSRPHILVVDDSISARKRVVRSLQRFNVEVVEACDGKQALEILKKSSFDAIFSDMEMPHVSGMELLADVNGKNHPNATPVVIISSRSEAEYTDRAKELGANNYLIKPLSDDALDEAIAGIPTLRHLNPRQPIEPLKSGEMQ